MIFTDEGKLSINGSGAVILTETTVLLKNLRDILADRGSIEEADKLIDECVADSRKTISELKGEVIELLKASLEEEEAEG